MDEKTQKEPEQTQPESFGHTDFPPDHTIDNPETTRPNDEAHEDTGQESEGPAQEPEHETLSSGSNDEDDGALENPAQSDTEEGDHDRGGINTADRVEVEVAQSDSSAIDDVEEIQGSSEEKVADEEIDEGQENKGDTENDAQTAPAQNEPEITDGEKNKDDVAEQKTIVTPSGKNSALNVAVWAVLIAAAFSGFFVFGNKSKVKATSQKALNAAEKKKISPNRHKNAKISKPATPIINSIYNAKIEELNALRDTLLLKQKEVMRLKKRYQEGVEELENEISDELQKGKSYTFLQALEDSAIAFTLRTIQRRQAYIQQLEGPSSWIHQACEELLYIKRQTMIDLQVAEIAGGIDMNKHLRHINAAVRKYQPTPDKLAPDMTNAKLEPLETIWKRIHGKTERYASIRAHSRNQIISEQICTGIFNRLSEISEVSPKTAKCITEMQASDLFLNDLTEISPAAARQLFQWKGNWVCLNGVRALSPRAAHYLFQWDGDLISLNGLTEFPAEIGEKLLQWEGHQLELMGLQYAEDFPSRIALEYLARWEQAGGKLFVPKEIRKKIDEVYRDSI